MTVDAPTFDDPTTADETETNPAPDGTTFKLGDDAPDGVKVDPKTGKITVTVPPDANGDPITIPVVVTYDDGTTDNVTATVTVNAELTKITHSIKLVDAQGKPITAPNVHSDGWIKSDGDSSNDQELSITYNGKTADFSGLTVTITDKDGNTTDAGTVWQGTKDFPAVRNFGLHDFPHGDYDVTISGGPAGWAMLKNPPSRDGLKDGKGTVTLSDTQFGNKFVYFGVDANNNGIADVDEKTTDSNDPKYDDGSGDPGTSVTVPAPTFDDPTTPDTEKNQAPDGTTFKPGDNPPDGVTVDPKTGEVTIQVPDDATPGDTIDVPVVVTYPDGSTDQVTVTVTVSEPTPAAPGWDDATVNPGESVDLPNKGGAVQDGTTVTVDGPGKATLNPDGSITVTPNGDAKPGDVITVTVTAPDGKVIDTIKVTVSKPAEQPPAKKPATPVNQTPSRLPKTGSGLGSGVAGIGGAAGALIAAGGAVVGFGRRNKMRRLER